MATPEVSEQEFERLADRELHQLIDAIIACSDEIDPELQSGVLNINFEDDTKYVVNSHRAARQIWMAAERKAWHFDFHSSSGRWIASSSSEELWSELSGVLSRKLGTQIELNTHSAEG